MIDIISSSIRIGYYIRLNTEYKKIYDFYHDEEKSNMIFAEYKDLLKRHFNRYGFYAFDYVHKLIVANLENKDEIAKNMAWKMQDNVFLRKEYSDILKSTQVLGGIIAKYIGELMAKITTCPVLEISPQTQKMQHLSNELSTSILRSGVFSWLLNPIKAKQIQQQSYILQNYEIETEKFRKAHPYNKNICKYIESLPPKSREVAYLAENMKFLEFLIKNAIIQGFFFNLFDIYEEDVIKIKEINKQNAIHPIVIKISKIFHDNHLMLFRFSADDGIKYILVRKMTINFSQNDCTTTLYGYTYPTNEYRLLVI